MRVYTDLSLEVDAWTPAGVNVALSKIKSLFRRKCNIDRSNPWGCSLSDKRKVSCFQ